MAGVVVDCQHARMLPASDIDRLQEALREVASALAAGEQRVIGEVRCLIVDEARIADLHERFFGDPSPTDVITFPANDSGDAQPVEGDIAICLDVAREQASAAGHSDLREIAFLGVHGILHLCGWRDDTPAQRVAMLERQDELLGDYERSNGRL